MTGLQGRVGQDAERHFGFCVAPQAMRRSAKMLSAMFETPLVSGMKQQRTATEIFRSVCSLTQARSVSTLRPAPLLPTPQKMWRTFVLESVVVGPRARSPQSRENDLAASVQKPLTAISFILRYQLWPGTPDSCLS